MLAGSIAAANVVLFGRLSELHLSCGDPCCTHRTAPGGTPRQLLAPLAFPGMREGGRSSTISRARVGRFPTTLCSSRADVSAFSPASAGRWTLNDHRPPSRRLISDHFAPRVRPGGCFSIRHSVKVDGRRPPSAAPLPTFGPLCAHEGRRWSFLRQVPGEGGRKTTTICRPSGRFSASSPRPPCEVVDFRPDRARQVVRDSPPAPTRAPAPVARGHL